MSLIASLALAAAAGSSLPQCSWDRPGANPFMGDVVAAVDHYRDIPVATRDKLKARMKARRYDEIAVIERDAIKGQYRYAAEIRDMHFGPGAVCRTVTRANWAPAAQERGLVYCEDGECILVPTVCRNVSRIRRQEPAAAAAPAQAGNLALSTQEGEDSSPLEFEAPAAGPLAAASPDSFARQSAITTLADGGAPASGGGGLLGGGGGSSFAGGPGAGGPPLMLGMPALPPGTVRPADATPGSPATDAPPNTVLPAPDLPAPGPPDAGLPPADPSVPAPPTSPGLPDSALPDVVTPAVPEPGTWALIATGLLVIGYRSSRTRRR